MILKGDVITNVGQYLPCPFIRKIEIADEEITAVISVYISVTTPANMANLIQSLSRRANLYLYMTAQPDRLESIVSGDVNPLQYMEGEALLTRHRPDPIYVGDAFFSVDDIFSSTVDTDGNLSYTYLVNSEVYTDDGQQMWEFRIDTVVPVEGTALPSSVAEVDSVQATYLIPYNYYRYYMWGTALGGDPEAAAAYDSDASADLAAVQDEWAAAWSAALTAGTTVAESSHDYYI